MGGPGSNDLVGNELWRGSDGFPCREPRHLGSSAFPFQATVEKVAPVKTGEDFPDGHG
jgi:hypothetical protein